MRKFLLFIILPAITVAQTKETDLPLHLREIPKQNLAIDLGIAEPIGNYGDIARSGLSVGLTYDYYFNKNIGLSFSGRHTYNETGFTMQPNGPSPQNESYTQFTAGLLASKTFNRFQIDAFARAGISFLDVNEDNGFASDNDDRFHLINDDTKDSSATLDLGLRFNYYFRRSVQLYFSPQLLWTIGKPLVYDTSLEFLSSNPGDLVLARRKSNLSNLLFTVGVKFALGPKYTNGELRDDSELDN